MLILLSVISIAVPNLAAGTAAPGSGSLVAAKEVASTAYVYYADYGYAYNYYDGIYRSSYFIALGIIVFR